MKTSTQYKSTMGKPRILIVGCGDVGMRLLPFLVKKYRVFALTSQLARHAELRQAGALPITANLDQPQSLKRLAGLANIIIHLAPPKAEGIEDQRTHNLIAILTDKCRLVYVSTTGVYGNCNGDVFDEVRPVTPNNARAVRRVSAENSLRRWAIRTQSRLAILRVPGIYADNRLPLERLKKATPALIEEDDVYTNHIHADDLAILIYLSLFRSSANRIYHAVDDSDLKMAQYFDVIADAFQLPRSPRLPRSELAQQVSPVLLSFMSESRRLLNHRMKAELGMRLRYPTVTDALKVKINVSN